MTDEMVDAAPDQILAVVEQMPGLPWPEGDDPLEWEVDGLEGATTWLMHVLPLAATSDASAVAALLARLAASADRRWGPRRRFDATRFPDASPDLATYDRRSTPAGLVRSYHATQALWWKLGSDAVMLVDGSSESSMKLAAILVLPADWLDGPGGEEAALRDPLVADLLSGENRRVLHAAWEIIGTRDVEVLAPIATALAPIERATAELDLGGMLLSNRVHLDHALERVRLFAEHTCLCAAYPGHPLYEPSKERDHGHVRIVGEVPGPYGRPLEVCECTTCGRRFEVESGDYHYPWWKWSPLPGAPEPEQSPR